MKSRELSSSSPSDQEKRDELEGSKWRERDGEEGEVLVTVGEGVREGGGQGGLLGDGGLLEAEEGSGGDSGGRGDGGEATRGGALPSGELGRGGGNLGHGGGHLLGRLQEALPHRWCGAEGDGRSSRRRRRRRWIARRRRAGSTSVRAKQAGYSRVGVAVGLGPNPP